MPRSQNRTARRGWRAQTCHLQSWSFSDWFGLPVQLGQLLLHGLADFLGAEVEENRLIDEVVDGKAQPSQAFGLAVDLPLFRHEEAHALARFQYPVTHQLRV